MLLKRKVADWQEFFAELKTDRRAAVLSDVTSPHGDANRSDRLWVAAERLPQLQADLSDSVDLQPPIAAPESVSRTRLDV